MKLKLINDGISKEVIKLPTKVLEEPKYQIKYSFDFKTDSPNDIVYFYGEYRTVKSFKTDNIIVYYGYRNKHSSYQNDAINISKMLKSDVKNNATANEFINMAANEFKNFLGSHNFKPDMITYPESGSDFNEEFANRLSSIGKVVHNGLQKLHPSDIKINKDLMVSSKAKQIEQKKLVEKTGVMLISFKKSLEAFRKGKDESDFQKIDEMLELCKNWWKEIDRNKKDEMFNEVCSAIPELWASSEYRKLIPILDRQIRKGHLNIKDFTAKDKRQFIDFLQNDDVLTQSFKQFKSTNNQTDQEVKKIKVLIIDDNVDSGATFEVINRLNRDDVEYMFYAPFRIFE